MCTVRRINGDFCVIVSLDAEANRGSPTNVEASVEGAPGPTRDSHEEFAEPHLATDRVVGVFETQGHCKLP